MNKRLGLTITYYEVFHNYFLSSIIMFITRETIFSAYTLNFLWFNPTSALHKDREVLQGDFRSSPLLFDLCLKRWLGI